MVVALHWGFVRGYPELEMCWLMQEDHQKEGTFITQ
jgi:hypothetical protein